MILGRPREFDRSAALETIMQVFWEKGFDATTKRDLMEATGVASQSLYNAFGDKRALFKEALFHYSRTRAEQVREMLTAPGSPLANLRGFVELWANVPEEFEKGCFLCNSLSEFGQGDDEIAEFLREKILSMRGMYLDVLQSAREAGEIRPDAEVEAIASMLVSSSNGVMLLQRAKGAEQVIAETVRGTLQVLDAQVEGKSTR